MDNFLYYSFKLYVVAHHEDRLDETILMRGHYVFVEE